MDNYNPPYTYEMLNRIDGQMPQAFVKIHNTAVSRFFKRYLFQDAISTLKWNLPENWDPDYFRYCLFGFGFVTIFKTDLFGVIPQHCTLSGINVFYRPTKALIANPLIQTTELDINRNCVLLKLQPDYGSVCDLVDYYGDLMALTYESLAMNILNVRLAYLVGVDGKAEADKFKLIFDEIMAGKPAVIYRKEKPQAASLAKVQPNDQWQMLLQNLRETFIAPDMLEALNAIRDEFLTMIGIPNISDRKKERVNTIDSQRNVNETQAKIDLWIDELSDGIDRAKDMFPELEELSFEKRYKPEDLEVNVNNESQSVRDRTL